MRGQPLELEYPFSPPLPSRSLGDEQSRTEQHLFVGRVVMQLQASVMTREIEWWTRTGARYSKGGRWNLCGAVSFHYLKPSEALRMALSAFQTVGVLSLDSTSTLTCLPPPPLPALPLPPRDSTTAFSSFCCGLSAS